MVVQYAVYTPNVSESLQDGYQANVKYFREPASARMVGGLARGGLARLLLLPRWGRRGART